VHSPLDDITGVQRQTLIKKSDSIKANFEHVDVNKNFDKKEKINVSIGIFTNCLLRNQYEV
jgi:hypothetical protein